MDYTDLYFTHLFMTLGQLSAFVISTSVAVPVLTYYKTSIKNLFNED